MYGTTSEKVLRIGLAFSFIYPAVSAWFNPFAWIGYFPPFMIEMAGEYSMLLLHTFGVTELLIGAWLIFGKRVFVPSAIAFVYLLGIIVFNLGQLDVIFRDVSIAAIAVALILSEREQKKMLAPEESPQK